MTESTAHALKFFESQLSGNFFCFVGYLRA